MTPEQFCYWLQGFVELNGHFPPSEVQWKSIGEHLRTVFEKVTPNAFEDLLERAEPSITKSMRRDSSGRIC